MINEVILVGKLIKKVGFRKVKGKKWYIIILGVEKPLRNGEGFYEVEEIECALWQGDSYLFEEENYTYGFMSIKGRIEKLFDEHSIIVVEKIKLLDAYLK
ncbi:MAG: hypothetical protein KHY88_03435 [Erysipelotrichaceae bacterium]|nr:hypothetical protein [Erysipelotrichaceae bacterium]